MKIRVLFILFFLAIHSFAFAQKNKAVARLESTDGITGLDEVKEFVRN